MFVQNMYILGFTEPLLPQLQNWRQLQWPPVGEGTSKLWHSHPVDATGHQRVSSGGVGHADDSHGHMKPKTGAQASPPQHTLYDSIYVTSKSQLHCSTVRCVRTVIALGGGTGGRLPDWDAL